MSEQATVEQQGAASPAPGDRSAQEHQNRSIFKRAVSGDEHALRQMIAAFVPDDERIVACAHLGTFGFVFRLRSFFAITDRRAVSITVFPFRGFLYTDGMLEHVNSSGIGQPARGKLYLAWVFIWGWALAVAAAGIFGAGEENGALGAAAAVAAIVVGWFLAAVFTRWWFRRNKSGIFLNVREGFTIQTFVDAKHVPLAMAMYRDFTLVRDDRLATLALSAA